MTVAARAAEWVWSGRGAPAAAARAALWPLEELYAAATGLRGLMYDRGILRSHALDLPAVSIGNLSVGGTGKTPVAAWFAAELRQRGARPAVVLRGYGEDEPLVHQTLNPDVPVVVAPDRVAGVARARTLGCDVAVLDDAFQHRRARRSADVVLLSADRWTGDVRLLPAGPWREPLRALRRAALALVTRKAADHDRAELVAERVRAEAPELPVAVALLAPDALCAAGGDGRQPLDALRGARVLAICAIGDPRAFHAQLRALGAEVDLAAFPDHHAFRTREVEVLAARGAGADRVVCTLKDAVKLVPHWPRAAAALWYVSQRVCLERGRGALDALVAGVLRDRAPRP